MRNNDQIGNAEAEATTWQRQKQKEPVNARLSRVAATRPAGLRAK